jgi:fluoroquinolone transport system permease protein
MRNFLVLLLGEMQRLQRYNIITASAVVALLWIGVLYLTEIPDITFIFPLLIFVDTTSMAMLMVGATIFFEKQEGSLRTLLVTPINKFDYLMTKSIITILSSVITLVILYLYAVNFKELSLNFFGLLGSVILVSLFHSLVGFLLTYNSRDFTGLLVNMFKYVFVFMFPTILEYINIIRHDLVEKILYLAPTRAAMLLLYAPTGEIALWELIYALAYMGFGSIILFVIALKQFNQFAAKESGV